MGELSFEKVGNRRGPQGPQGIPGPNTVPTAQAVADAIKIVGGASETEVKRLAVLAAQAEDAKRTKWGTFAARPAANTMPAGGLYFCTDTPDVFLSNGSAWSAYGSSGQMLAYAESVPMVSNDSVTPGLVNGFQVTFVAGSRPVEVVLNARVTCSAAGSGGVIVVSLPTVEIGRLDYFPVTSDTWETHQWSRVLSTLTAGTSYTINIKIARTGASGFARIGGDTNNPNSLLVRAV